VTGTRLRLETERVRDRIERGDPYWPAQLAIALAIVLALTLSDRVTIGPTWLVPAVEALCRLLGAEGYPFVTVGYPLNPTAMWDEDEASALAAQVRDGVRARLTR